MNTFILAKDIEQYVIDIRRDLHEYPEISMEEERTIHVVTKELEKMNIRYEIIPHGGIIGIIEGNDLGKTIVLRADLDALPMQEAETNLKQKKKVISRNDEAAHTCGHDGHTAMLLGAAKILVENQQHINGKILLAFEQGEEDGKGIYRLLRRLVEIGADGVWGIHLKSDIPSGKISVDPGPRMAGVFPFNIKITGKSGHGSRPDLAFSPIDCFNSFYNDLQAIKLNRLDPFKPVAYSIGSLSAGTTANIIPETLEFSGTVRFLHYEQGVKMQQEFNRLLDKNCDVYNCTYEYIEESAPMNLFVYNEATCAAIAKDSIVHALGEQTITHYPAWMASEPFSFYQKYFPGVFAFVGIKNDKKGTGAEHHNAHFDIDEDVLKLGVTATVEYALAFLNYAEQIDYPKEHKPVKQLFQEIGFPIFEPSDSDD